MQFIDRPFSIFHFISENLQYLLRLIHYQKLVLGFKDKFLDSTMKVRINLIFGPFLHDYFGYITSRNKLVFVLVLYWHPFYHTILLHIWNYFFQKIEDIILEFWLIFLRKLISINWSLLSITVFPYAEIDSSTNIIQKTTESFLYFLYFGGSLVRLILKRIFVFLVLYRLVFSLLYYLIKQKVSSTTHRQFSFMLIR